MSFVFWLALIGFVWWVISQSRRLDEETRLRSIPELDPIADSWEGSFVADAFDPVPVSARLLIDYRDVIGTDTKRHVRVYEFDKSNSRGLLACYCEMRKAPRTFRIDRIKSAVDLDTGEILNDVQSFLIGKYNASQAPSPSSTRPASTYPARDELSMIVECLVFTARADGYMRAPERKIVLEFLARYGNSKSSIPLKTEDGLKRLRKLSVAEFRQLVRNLKSLSHELKNALIAVARKIVETQDAVHPSEREALDYMKAELIGSALDVQVG